MKTIIALLGLCITATILISCGSKEVKPTPVNCYDHQTLVDGKCVDKPQPTPPPVVCTDKQELKDGVCVDKPAPVDLSHCDKTGKQYYCGNPVWYGFPKCGENGADGDIYFKDYQSLVEMMASKDRGLCLTYLKDGVVTRVPSPYVAPGPCASCLEINTAKSFMMRSQPKMVEICKVIDGQKHCTFSLK
jgi:hypothetical protein